MMDMAIRNVDDAAQCGLNASWPGMLADVECIVRMELRTTYESPI